MVCFVGLGSNLGDSKSYLKNALRSLEEHSSILNLISSGFYQSKPHGPKDQPDYINAVVRFNTALEAESLLDLLQSIENKNERTRVGIERWGARTLDMDLLLYGDAVINTKRLVIPHPHIAERAFVLLPLREVVVKLGLKDLKITKMATLQDLIGNLPVSEIKDIEKISND